MGPAKNLNMASPSPGSTAAWTPPQVIPRVTVIFLGFPPSAPQQQKSEVGPARKIICEITPNTASASSANRTITDILREARDRYFVDDAGINNKDVALSRAGVYTGPPDFALLPRHCPVGVLRDGDVIVVVNGGGPGPKRSAASTPKPNQQPVRPQNQDRPYGDSQHNQYHADGTADHYQYHHNDDGYGEDAGNRAILDFFNKPAHGNTANASKPSGPPKMSNVGNAPQYSGQNTNSKMGHYGQPANNNQMKNNNPFGSANYQNVDRRREREREEEQKTNVPPKSQKYPPFGQNTQHNQQQQRIQQYGNMWGGGMPEENDGPVEHSSGGYWGGVSSNNNPQHHHPPNDYEENGNGWQYDGYPHDDGGDFEYDGHNPNPLEHSFNSSDTARPQKSQQQGHYRPPHQAEPPSKIGGSAVSIPHNAHGAPPKMQSGPYKVQQSQPPERPSSGFHPPSGNGFNNNNKANYKNPTSAPWGQQEKMNGSIDMMFPGNKMNGPAGAQLPSSGGNASMFASQGTGLGISGLNGSKRPPRKRALLIGINYTGTKAELKGCINDVKNVHKLITTRFGFPDTPESIMVLTDEHKDTKKLPTKANMLAGFSWLVKDAQPGDSLYLHFSGHGSQQEEDGDDYEADGMDDTLVPLDYLTAGQIIDDDINALLVKSLPAGVRLTAFLDCCHSGTAMDLPYVFDKNGKLRGPPKMAKGHEEKASKGHVVMISGCKETQTSADATIAGSATGAMSFALLKTIQDLGPGVSYEELLKSIRDILRKKNYSQVPQLSAGHLLDVTQPFAP
ncbi:Ca(2+)-dependent cysteine protease [Quaeritorhiza haematococci]|nr:Ca(2+)-dependent cysteine protease [Quaeritorhiza haematococci]